MDWNPLKGALSELTDSYLASDEAALKLASHLEAAARYIAQNLEERPEIVKQLDPGSPLQIWQRLAEAWTALCSSFSTSASNSSIPASEDSRLNLATALAKFERNLVAGLLDHQQAALQHEEAIRRLIFHITSFSRIEDPRFFTLQAISTQLLSNVVSPVSSKSTSDEIATTQLSLYLSGNRENDVMIRLLDSQDPKVNISTLHLIGNLMRSSPKRQEMMLEVSGLAWLSKILGKMDPWLDLHDGRFELATSIFRSFIESKLQARLFSELAVANEPISPSQTTFLKILDSHLSDQDQSAQGSNDQSSPVKNWGSNTRPLQPSPNRFLVPVLQLLGAYATTSITHVPDDARLPKVFEALVLVCEALCSIGLVIQKHMDQGETTETHVDQSVVDEMKSAEDSEGVIKPLLELLRALDNLVPRVNPRRQAAAQDPALNRPVFPPDQARPISQLKRNVVRLLGILTYGDTAVGDQVRECGGVQLILSLTEVDEANPYLREHALFTVRNLMLNNPANQAIIREMDPIGVLSDTGEVLPVPERMRRPANGASN